MRAKLARGVQGVPMPERTELVTLAKRMLAHYVNGTTDQADDVSTVPVASYADKAPDALGVPVLVRGSDGVARSFLNVCRHRGAAIVDAGCGSARRSAPGANTHFTFGRDELTLQRFHGRVDRLLAGAGSDG